LNIFKKIWSSFPVQLLVVHVKHNQFLLVYWLILFATVNGNFGRNLGIPYLFLDPVYLDEVSIWGFMILGVAIAGFAMSYNITSYILDGFRFPFLGTLPRPLSHFCLNNATIPLVFVGFYIYKVIDFQSEAGLENSEVIIQILGFLVGCLAMLVFLFAYFFKTNFDIFKLLSIKNPLLPKKTVEFKKAFKKLQMLRRSKVMVNYYWGLNLKFYSTRRFEEYYDRLAILKVFIQNQRNAIVIESLVLVVIFSLSLFQNIPVLQIPAAASGVKYWNILEKT